MTKKIKLLLTLASALLLSNFASAQQTVWVTNAPGYGGTNGVYPSYGYNSTASLWGTYAYRWTTQFGGYSLVQYTNPVYDNVTNNSYAAFWYANGVITNAVWYGPSGTWTNAVTNSVSGYYVAKSFPYSPVWFTNYVNNSVTIPTNSLSTNGTIFIQNLPPVSSVTTTDIFIINQNLTNGWKTGYATAAQLKSVLGQTDNDFTNLVSQNIGYAMADCAADGVKPVAGGGLFTIYNPAAGFDIFGNAYTLNSTNNNNIGGTLFAKTNWLTMPLNVSLSNWTLCVSIYIDAAYFYPKIIASDTTLGLCHAAGLANTTNGDSFVYQPFSPYAHKIWTASSTNWGKWMTNTLNSQSNSFIAPMSCQFAYQSDIELTWHFYAFSFHNGQMRVFDNGRACGIGQSGSGLFTNKFTFDQIPAGLNTLLLGGGNTNWNRRLDTYPNGNPPGNNQNWGYGTNAYCNIGAFALYTNSVDESPAVQTNYFKFLSDLDPRQKVVVIQGSSILAVGGNTSFIYTNTFPVNVQNDENDYLVLNEASQGGGGISGVFNLSGSWTNNNPLPSANLWLNPVKYQTRRVLNDQQRNGANTANYVSYYSPYRASGWSVEYICTHPDFGTGALNDGTPYGFAYYTNTWQVLQAFPHSKVWNEWSFWSQGLVNDMGGNVHGAWQNNPPTLAHNQVKAFADFPFSGVWPNAYATTTNFTLPNGTYTLTNCLPIPRQITWQNVGGCSALSVFRAGVGRTYSFSTNPPLPLVLFPFGDVMTITATNGTVNIDTIPANQ